MTSAQHPTEWHVVCLCAAWCGVCRDWLPLFRELASAHPQAHFAVIDVEDEADAMGEVEVETFPTLLIAQGLEPRFFGPVQPSAAQVSRLLERLQSGSQGMPVPPAIHALLARIQPLLRSARV